MTLPSLLLLLLLAALVPPISRGTEAPETLDAVPDIPLRTGEVIDQTNLDRIRDYLPAEFWKNREYFFYEGMRLQIGQLHADYGPSDARRALTAEYGGQAWIGRDGSLENYSLGLPFPDLDLETDPQAGVKLAWNMDYKHDALEGKGRAPMFGYRVLQRHRRSRLSLASSLAHIVLPPVVSGRGGKAASPALHMSNPRDFVGNLLVLPIVLATMLIRLRLHAGSHGGVRRAGRTQRLLWALSRAFAKS